MLESKGGIGTISTIDQQCRKRSLNLITSNLLRIYLFNSTRHRFIIDSAFLANSLFTRTKYLLYFSMNQLNTRLKLTVADQFTFTRASRFLTLMWQASKKLNEKFGKRTKRKKTKKKQKGENLANLDIEINE